MVFVKGLDAGEYTLKEIQAPAGYNLITEDITVTVTPTYVKNNSTISDRQAWTYGEDDTNTTRPDSTSAGTALTALNITSKIGIADAEDATIDTNKGKGTITVQNNKGSGLPSTGGIGTTLFYLAGGVMVVGAGVVLVTKKRLGKED